MIRLLALIFLSLTITTHTIDAKRILVTGGAGFLGSHLCERLLERGDEVVCVDNLLTGSLRNIQSFRDNPNFSFIDCDICDFSDPYTHYDEIYNLACPASPKKYQKDPIHTLRTNFIGTQNLLELAKRNRAKFFQASTSEIYGNPIHHPQAESYFGNVNPIGVRACYDEGKRVAETLCFEYYRQHDVAIKVVRIFNTYGPKMSPHDGRVVSNFIIQSLTNQPITIYGDGSQTRSFCYVDDLIDGFLAFMDTGNNVTGPFNLGSQMEITVGELAERVVKMTKSCSPIHYKPLPQDDPVRRKPDLTQTQMSLGWGPSTSLKEGLQKTIDHFRQQLKLQEKLGGCNEDDFTFSFRGCGGDFGHGG